MIAMSALNQIARNGRLKKPSMVNLMKMTKRMLALVACSISISAWADPLESGFAHPPDQTKPWCYYYWISDNLSKTGITKDLEAMSRVGIGEALIGNIFLDD